MYQRTSRSAVHHPALSLKTKFVEAAVAAEATGENKEEHQKETKMRARERGGTTEGGGEEEKKTDLATETE